MCSTSRKLGNIGLLKVTRPFTPSTSSPSAARSSISTAPDAQACGEHATG
jgi:hypothetical protein